MSNQPHSNQNHPNRAENMLALARPVQRAFLPRTPPAVAGYEFFFHYQPAVEIGGDHFDCLRLADGRVATIILDVAGKDVPASLLKPAFQVNCASICTTTATRCRLSES